MKSSFRFLRVCALAALVAAAMSGSAQAAVITIVPDAVNVPVGGTVSADINVSLATGETLGAFTFDVQFNDAVLSGTGVTFNTTAFPADPLDFGYTDAIFDGVGGSPLFMSGAIDFSCADAACLSALQGTGFRLATVTFDAVGPGFSPLALDFTFGGLYDFEGLEIPFTVRGSGVCVGTAPCPVPEPVSGSLLLAGLAAAVGARRMTRRA